MAKSKKRETFPILLDLHYRYSMNHFEEFYGDSVSYSEIEQTSYIDLKEMAFEKISRAIKFRKFGRHKNILTVKMDISASEYETFLKIFNEEDIDEEASKRDGKTRYIRFNFIHDFTISNIRDLTREEKIKFKKVLEPSEESEEEDEDIIEDDDVNDNNLEYEDEIIDDDMDDDEEEY
jgi:hypothetical protein